MISHIIRPRLRNISRSCRYETLNNRSNVNIQYFIVSSRAITTEPSPSTSTASSLVPSDSFAWIKQRFTSFCNASDVPSVDGGITEVVTSTNAVETLGTYPSHYAMYLIDNIHTFTGLPYWQTIIGVTIALRVCLLPIAIKGLVNAGRLAAMRPETQMMQDAFNANPNNTDPAVRLQFQQDMQAIFKKHKVHPLQALAMPFLQIPVFVTFFFALNHMSQYYPDLKTGGAFWFVDLTMPDPLYILPIVNGISFLLMVELGADGMAGTQANQAKLMKHFLRSLAVVMVPFTASFPESVFMYWTANNSFSVAQTLILKKTPVKKWLGIPDPPKETPPNVIRIASLEAMREKLNKMEEEKKMAESSKVARDFSVGSAAPATPPPPPVAPPPITVASASSETVKTFAHKPKISKKKTA